MEPNQQKQANLFQVFLRLRPPPTGQLDAERFLTVEKPSEGSAPTHVTLNPPNDRRRAVEMFNFTQIFEEDATQLDVFHCTAVVSLVEGVIAPHGGEGTDALLATLGVTGSGKSHTILGSRSQRGLTQLALDVVFRSIGSNMLQFRSFSAVEGSISSSDASEASILSASAFLETVFVDNTSGSRTGSRAPTPMIVGSPAPLATLSQVHLYPSPKMVCPASPKSVWIVRRGDETGSPAQTAFFPMQTPKRAASPPKHYMTVTAAASTRTCAKTQFKGEYGAPPPPTPRRLLPSLTSLPQSPDVSSVSVSSDPSADYLVLISMYEVYNDRIFDLLTPPIKSQATKEYRRRPLLFKPTELSPDRKVVAGLRKIACTTLAEALMVLEAGLHERRVAGTGSNSVSSRSHGFFCVEVKKRAKGRSSAAWGGSTFTIVDLAGSERARDAKTAGATLAEAGKINESLMYLGQCLQVQTESMASNKPSVVPFRQCKLTELLFSNSFPSSALSQSTGVSSTRSRGPSRNPQKAVMVVTADPHGDFNATREILRYGALARNVIVPRLPSTTETLILPNNTGSTAVSGAAGSGPSSSRPTSPTAPGPQRRQPFFPPGPNMHRNFSPHSASSGGSEGDRVTMEIAALEIARMAEEIDHLRTELAVEHERRIVAEAHLLTIEDRMVDLEQAVREDCAVDFERLLALELARYRASLQLEVELGGEHWDRKIEVFERGIGHGRHPLARDDGDDEASENKENVLIETLEDENSRLRRELAVLRRELGGQSPSKRMPLQERGGPGVAAGLERSMERLRVSDARSSTTSNGSPTRKVRKMTSKRWEVAIASEE